MSQRTSFDQVVGLSDAHIDSLSLEKPVHQALVEPLQSLKRAAIEQGYGLQIASGFRGFARQLAIWNAKAAGTREVLGVHGERLNPEELSAEEWVSAILRWSALPGASRHHWGSDIDIYDAAAVSDTYRVQLTVNECEGAGPFTAMHQWLNTYLQHHPEFYRPYCRDAGGVAPEPWHLSYRPLAETFQTQLTEAALKALLEQTDIQLKPVIMDNFHHIYSTYVVAPC